MIVFALDSSAPIASVAVARDDTLLGLFTRTEGLTHSETLLPMAEALLRSLSLRVEEVDLFACSAGPGSFTGVRIGVSMLKGLAFGQKKPCAAVSTLDALAYQLNGLDGIFCPVMDARRSQVYNALFAGGKTAEALSSSAPDPLDFGRIRLTSDRLISLEELQQELSAYDAPIYLTGDGYALAQRGLRLPNLQVTPPLLRCQNAFAVAQCARRMAQCGQIVDDVSLRPIYLRASQAEREREEKLRQAGAQ